MKKIVLILFLSSCYLVANINDNCKVIALNHIKSENAIAMLKGLGYSVIDYSQDDNGSYIPKIDSFDEVSPQKDNLTIIKFPSKSTEYLDAGLVDGESAGLDGMSSYLGGNSMPDIISGEPPERVMVCYDNGSESDFREIHVSNALSN